MGQVLGGLVAALVVVGGSVAIYNAYSARQLQALQLQAAQRQNELALQQREAQARRDADPNAQFSKVISGIGSIFSNSKVQDGIGNALSGVGSALG